MELLEGRPESRIADELFRSHSAIHEHVTAIYRHFAVASRSELAAHFLRRQPKRRAAAAPLPPDSIEAWLHDRRQAPTP